MKHLLFFYFLLFVVPFSFSQVTISSKLGLAHSTFLVPAEYSHVTDNKYKNNFYFGSQTNIPLDEKRAVVFELMYVQKGTTGVPGSLLDRQLELSYLSVPVLFNYTVLPKLHLHAGPEVSFLLGAKLEHPSTTRDMAPNFQGVDLGLATGISYDLFKGVFVEARFTEGLTHIQQGLFGEVSGGRAGRNRSFQFGIGYQLFNIMPRAL